jgi:hypothetical protein
MALLELRVTGQSFQMKYAAGNMAIIFLLTLLTTIQCEMFVEKSLEQCSAVACTGCEPVTFSVRIYHPTQRSYISLFTVNPDILPAHVKVCKRAHTGVHVPLSLPGA